MRRCGVCQALLLSGDERCRACGRPTEGPQLVVEPLGVVGAPSRQDGIVVATGRRDRIGAAAVAAIAVALVATAVVTGRSGASSGVRPTPTIPPPAPTSPVTTPSPATPSTSTTAGSGLPADIDVPQAVSQRGPRSLDIAMVHADGTGVLERVRLGDGFVHTVAAAAGALAAVVPAPGGSAAVGGSDVLYVDDHRSPVRIGSGTGLAAGPRPDTVWLYQHHAVGHDALQLVDVLTDVVERDVVLPEGTTAVVAGGAQPVVATNGQGSFRVDPSTGAATRISTGVVESARDGWFTDLTCDEHLACVLALHGVDGARRVLVDGEDAPATRATVGPGGRTVVLTTAARQYLAPRYEVVEAATGRVLQRVLIALPVPAEPQWSVDGHWLFLASGDTIAAIEDDHDPQLIRVSELGTVTAFAVTG
jgi:hypothetical protein